MAMSSRNAAGSASPFRVEPFSVAVDAAVIDDLRARIRRSRLPEAAPGGPWDQGADRDWLAGLLGYWAEGFDWQAAERELNSVAHYRARIGEAEVHFVHERARHGGGIPLVLGHGWPSCFAELLPLVPLLTDPGTHGISGPAFDVVIPSLPGYGSRGVPTGRLCALASARAPLRSVTSRAGIPRRGRGCVVSGNLPCCQPRRSRIWRLIRASIAAMPRSRSGLTRSCSPSWLENSPGVACTSSALSP